MILAFLKGNWTHFEDDIEPFEHEIKLFLKMILKFLEDEIELSFFKDKHRFLILHTPKWISKFDFSWGRKIQKTGDSTMLDYF